MQSKSYPRPGRRVRRDAPLTSHFGLKVADDEAEQIRAAAAAEGKTVSQWLRGTALNASAQYVESINTAGAAVPEEGA